MDSAEFGTHTEWYYMEGNFMLKLFLTLFELDIR